MASSAVADQLTKSQSVSHAVVSAVAELTGSDPMSLEPLSYTIDPDALNALFESSGAADRSPARVSFDYCGCDVEVRGDGAVTATRSGREVTKRAR